eukprot:15285010-Alexandrium_andersonii.AAC.1
MLHERSLRGCSCPGACARNRPASLSAWRRLKRAAAKHACWPATDETARKAVHGGVAANR